MRYIGNKENLCDKIHYTLLSQQIQGESLFDVFAGTTSVSQYFKHKGYQITSSNLMYFSFVLQKAYIANNNTQLFSALATELPHTPHKLFTSNLEIVLSFLDNIFPIDGFIFKNYTPEGTAHLPTPRMYFSNENGRKIDAIRQQIELWYQKNDITENEYFVLLACLIESVSFYANVAGIYAAFHKKWDPRATKTLTLRPIKLLNNHKAGDKNQIIHIPDLILLDFARCEVINIEGKKYQFRHNGIAELANYDYIEEHYIKKYYNPRKIIRTVVLYGSTETQLIEIEIGFLLNQNGQLILGVQAPELFKEAIKNLLDFWNPCRN